MQNGWALQSGTSHYLGQNFAKAFDVTFQAADGRTREHVWATSWGVSTRLLGALVMTHSDDKGLALPPSVAPVQAVVVAVGQKKKKAGDAAEDAVDVAVRELAASFKAAGVRARVDDRAHLRPGARFYEWERKGVPIRVEVGPRDVEAGQCVFAYRVGDSEKVHVPLADAGAAAAAALAEIQQTMLATAKARLAARTFPTAAYADMVDALASGDPERQGFYLAPWKDDAANENAIKDDCKATVRCYPLDLQDQAEGKACFYSGEPATHMAIFARAY